MAQNFFKQILDKTNANETRKKQNAKSFFEALDDSSKDPLLSYGGFIGADNYDDWTTDTSEGRAFAKDYESKITETFSVNNLLGKCSSEQISQIESRDRVDPGTYTAGTFPDSYDGNSEVFCNPDSTFADLQAELSQMEKVAAAELYLDEFGEQIGDAASIDMSDPLSFLTDILNIGDQVRGDEGRQALQNLIGDIDEQLYGKGRQISFKEQCFFLANIQQFVAARKMLNITPGASQDFRKELPDIISNGARGNRCISVDGEPFSFVNKLTQSPTKQFLFDMKNDEISSLQPLIRLFKVISDENGDETLVEFKFDTHYTKGDIESLLTTAEHRGHGVGIKSFNFAYEANNPFAIKKSISAKLVLHAANFGELLRDRGTDPTYKYADLALKTGTLTRVTSNPQNAEVLIDNAEKLNFRLRAVVGWARPNGFGTLLSQESLTAVYNSSITLNLTPTIHNFDVDDSGRVTFTLNYLAYVEDYFDQPNFDIFSDTKTIVDQVVRNSKITIAEKKCKAKDVTKELSDADKQKIEDEKKENLRSLMTSMIARNKLRVIGIPINELNQYRIGGPTVQVDPGTMYTYMERLIQGQTASSADRQAQIDEQLEEDDDENPTTNYATGADVDQFLGANNPTESVTFFWISDLIDVILSNLGNTLEEIPKELERRREDLNPEQQQQIDEEIINAKRRLNNFKKFRIVLGPVEIVNANVGTGENIQFLQANLGDIPVSAKYFMEWLTNKMLKVNRQNYPLPVFLNDLFNQFVRDFLNNDPCYGNTIKQKVRVAQTAVTAFKSITTENQISLRGGSDFQEDLETLLEEQIASDGYGYTLDLTKLEEQPVLQVMGPIGDVRSTGEYVDEYNYMIYHAARVQPMELLQADRAKDINRGVFHYGIGRDRGIIKNISLQKTQTPGLAEVRFEQEGYDGLKQLRVLYDANIKTYLDVTCYPGTYIYVEPRSFDPTLEPEEYTSLGIGGYYMVTRTDHSMGPGIAETNITAKWVAQVHASTVYSSLPDCEETNRQRRATLGKENIKASYGDFSDLLTPEI